MSRNKTRRIKVDQISILEDEKFARPGQFCEVEKGQPVQSGHCTNSERHFSTPPFHSVLKKVALSKGQSEGLNMRCGDPKQAKTFIILESLLSTGVWNI